MDDSTIYSEALTRVEELLERARGTSLREPMAMSLATANADGQPYIQHRGGPKGFLKVLDEHTLAFADFVGNAQYISVGNLDENNKAFMFLMDYPNRHRIKIWGMAEVVEDDDELFTRLVDAGYRGKPERALVFHVKAWDINCPQHITPRWTEEEAALVINELQARVDELEKEKNRLRDRVAEFSTELIAT